MGVVVPMQQLLCGHMPTVLRLGPYRFYFFAGDRDEPAHVHIGRDTKRAKVWLDPVRLESSGEFRPNEIRRIVDLVRTNEIALLREWHEYFTE